jgi:hypothetical protein
MLLNLEGLGRLFLYDFQVGSDAPPVDSHSRLPETASEQTERGLNLFGVPFDRQLDQPVDQPLIR